MLLSLMLQPLSAMTRCISNTLKEDTEVLITSQVHTQLHNRRAQARQFTWWRAACRPEQFNMPLSTAHARQRVCGNPEHGFLGLQTGVMNHPSPGSSRTLRCTPRCPISCAASRGPVGGMPRLPCSDRLQFLAGLPALLHSPCLLYADS